MVFPSMDRWQIILNLAGYVMRITDRLDGTDALALVALTCPDFSTSNRRSVRVLGHRIFATLESLSLTFDWKMIMFAFV